MSRTMNARHRKYRLQLLASVSAAVLLGSAAQAAGGDAYRPPLWIELGWQFERGGGGQESFAPFFVDTIAANGFTSPLKIENALGWSYGADGKISYRPEGSDWNFWASIRYGRAHGYKSVHQQKPAHQVAVPIGTRTFELSPYHWPFSETKAANRETHAILDFQAGKDIGVGLFGQGSTATLSAGVRYAQIKFGSRTAIDSDPDKYFPTNVKYSAYNHVFHATNEETRSFKGLGPALSWNASVPLAGDPQNTEIALDWGINAGVLFGKQKARGQHQTSAHYYKTGVFSGKYSYHHYGAVVPHDRSRSVTVPNLGGFAGLSLNWSNAKMSFGYRADVFFKAIDGGIDTRKSENRGFYGPFASISIGLGD